MAVVVDKEWLEAGLTDVSDSIRGLLETEEKLAFPQGMKEAVNSYSLDEPLEAQDALIEQIKTALQGKASGGEDLLQYATFINGNVFRNAVFPDNYEFNFKTQGSEYAIALSFFLMGTNIKKCVFEVIKKETTCTINGMFNNCKLLEEVIFVDKIVVNNLSASFLSCEKLKSVNGVIDCFASTNNNTCFYKCYLLEDVCFAENSIIKTISFGNSPLLSAKSIQSIVDGLADLTGGTSQTLTLHADVKAKLTEEQISQITSKNWTLA